MKLQYKKIPFIFARYRKCTPENGLKPNVEHGDERVTYVVKLSQWDMKCYDSSWMDDDNLPKFRDDNLDTDYCLIPDVDITEQTFVFDSDDAVQNEIDALNKMKELWALVE